MTNRPASGEAGWRYPSAQLGPGALPAGIAFLAMLYARNPAGAPGFLRPVTAIPDAVRPRDAGPANLVLGCWEIETTRHQKKRCCWARKLRSVRHLHILPQPRTPQRAGQSTSRLRTGLGGAAVRIPQALRTFDCRPKAPGGARSRGALEHVGAQPGRAVCAVTPRSSRSGIPVEFKTSARAGAQAEGRSGRRARQFPPPSA